MKQLINALKIRFNENFNEAKSHLFTLSIIIIIGFFGFFIINYFFTDYNSSHDSLILRITVAIVAIPFLLPTRIIPKWFNRFAPLYFHFLLLYTFSFFFAFLFFKNPYSYIWTVNIFVGLSILMLFLDWLCYLIISVLGFAIASLCFFLTTENIILPDYFSGVLISYISPSIYFILFSHRKNLIQKEKNMRMNMTKKINEELEQKVQERTIELQEALTIKTDFLNNISHEIRAPINGFSMATDNLINHWRELGEEQRYEMVMMIAKSAARINNLTAHLIELSKLSSKTKKLNLQEVNICDLIKDLIDECKDLYLSDKKIKMSFKPQMPYYIEADKEAMGQVFRNIFVNSIKFSPDDSTITIKVAKQDNFLKITISDAGVGIPEAELNTIFKSFTQSSRTKSGAGGTGLGLAIAKQIVEQHNGQIYAQNNEKAGCSFIVTIPVLEKIPQNKKNIIGEILVIDDEEIALNVIKTGLILNGFNVATAVGGEEGLKYLQEHHSNVQIVLLDLMMPDIYGLDVLKIIKEKYPHIIVIIQSGIADDGEICKAMSLGAHKFFRKPYKINEVVTAIANC